MSYIDQLAAKMPPEVLENFRPMDRLALRRSMAKCGMSVLPAAGDDLRRASKDVICDTCGQSYGDHPLDWRAVGYNNLPCLHILCNGELVKL